MRRMRRTVSFLAICIGITIGVGTPMPSRAAVQVEDCNNKKCQNENCDWVPGEGWVCEESGSCVTASDHECTGDGEWCVSVWCPL
jgi:hypothetical protein